MPLVTPGLRISFSQKGVGRMNLVNFIKRHRNCGVSRGVSVISRCSACFVDCFVSFLDYSLSLDSSYSVVTCEMLAYQSLEISC